jgi:hypothetical protein
MGRTFLEVATLVVTGIIAGVVLSHVLQQAPKATLDAEVYVPLQQTLYRNYRNTIGMAEVVATFLIGVLAWLDWKDGRGVLSLIALACLLGMIAIFVFGLNAINQSIAAWTTEALPADWMKTRDRWHLLHAIRAVLAVVALTALSIRAFPRRTNEG